VTFTGARVSLFRQIATSLERLLAFIRPLLDRYRRARRFSPRAASFRGRDRLCNGRVDVRRAHVICARARQAKSSTVRKSSTCVRLLRFVGNATSERPLGLVLAGLWEPAGGELGPPALGRREVVDGDRRRRPLLRRLGLILLRRESGECTHGGEAGCPQSGWPFAFVACSAVCNISTGATSPGTAPSRSAIRRSSGSCSQRVIVRFERPTIAPASVGETPPTALAWSFGPSIRVPWPITRTRVDGGWRRPDREQVKRGGRRPGAIAATITVAALVLTVLTAGASASPSEVEQSGALTMTSDPGDYIGQGLAYSYATPANVFFATVNSWYGPTNMVTVSMRTDSSSTDGWSLRFAAPAGQTLADGTYLGAARAVSQTAGQPGLDVSGMGRSCNTVSGSFTVSDAIYGPYGYVQSFHATFEQHCEGAPPALGGEVAVSNPPPPPPLTAQITIDPAGQLTRSGAVITHGTVTCNRPVDPDRSFIQVTVSEPSKTGAITGAAAFSVPSNCSTTPNAWQATITPTDPKQPFIKGSATTSAWARLGDPFFDVLLYTDTVTAPLALKEG
jgi:hypothetical protein